MIGRSVRNTKHDNLNLVDKLLDVKYVEHGTSATRTKFNVSRMCFFY